MGSYGLIHLFRKYFLSRIFVLTILMCIFVMPSASCGGENTVENNNGQISQSEDSGQDRWGFIDKKGNIAIPPAYQLVGGFEEGLSSVLVDSKWGFINTEGDMVIQPQFPIGRYSDKDILAGGPCFSEGLAVMVFDNHKYGYIDKAGKVAIEPQFDYASSFSEDVAMVMVKGKYGFINKTGEFEIQPVFEYADNYFSEGLVSVRYDIRPPYGCIDKTGDLLISPQFENECGARFSEGLAAVSWEHEGLFGFVDLQGNRVIEPTFRYAGSFSEGLAYVQFLEGGSGFIGRTGKTVFLIDCHFCDPFSEGFARFYTWDGSTRRYGFIDKNGVVTIEPIYPNAGYFSEDLAEVCTEAEGLYGFIDGSGAMVISPQYEQAMGFREGLAPVKLPISEN